MWKRYGDTLVSDSGEIKHNGKYLRQYSSNGYRQVIIDGKHIMVHRLVASAFIPNPDEKPQVNHKDGNRSNNKVSNLEWVTARENIRHAKDILHPIKRNMNYREYLKQLRISKNMTMQEVADAFEISRQYYEMIESGDRQKKMDFTFITKISTLFGVSIEQIAKYEQEILDEKEVV